MEDLKYSIRLSYFPIFIGSCILIGKLSGLQMICFMIINYCNTTEKTQVVMYLRYE